MMYAVKFTEQEGLFKEERMAEWQYYMMQATIRWIPGTPSRQVTNRATTAF